MRKELHHFSDASTCGYGQCTYLRQVSEDGSVHCALVMAKSRVTPIKVTTIPRLELAAAVVSVTASNTVKEELSLSDARCIIIRDCKICATFFRQELQKNKADRCH